MNGAATVASVCAVLAVTTTLGVALAIWLPALTALTCTVALVVEESRRSLRRWRATRRWAARLSA